MQVRLKIDTFITTGALHYTVMTVLSIHHQDGVATFDESDNVVDVIDVDGSDAVRVYYPDNSYDDYYHATITNVRFE